MVSMTETRELINPLKPELVWTVYKNSVRTSKRTPYFTITKINWLMLFKEIIFNYPFEDEACLNAI
jgi:hypothetical protein